MKKRRFASDIWSIGCTLVGLFCGQHTYFRGPNDDYIYYDVNRYSLRHLRMFIAKFRGGPVPESLILFLHSFLEKDPRKRPLSGALLTHEIFAALKELNYVEVASLLSEELKSIRFEHVVEPLNIGAIKRDIWRKQLEHTNAFNEVFRDVMQNRFLDSIPTEAVPLLRHGDIPEREAAFLRYQESRIKYVSSLLDIACDIPSRAASPEIPAGIKRSRSASDLESIGTSRALGASCPKPTVKWQRQSESESEQTASIQVSLTV